MFKCGYLSHGMYVSFGLKGDVLPCCYASKNTPSGKKYKTTNILNGPLVTKLRKQALENKVPDICDGCMKKEEITGFSPRLSNYYFNDNTVKEVISEEDVRYIQVKLSNVCNFQCTICSAYDSHLIGKEEGHSNPLQLIDDDLYNELKEKLPKMSNLQLIIFSGGETFYNSKKLIDLLDYIPDTVKTVAMHTNGSLFNKPILDRLNEFKKTVLSFSFDGSGRFFEYQRRNGKWNIAFDNLKRIKENYSKIFLQCNNTITNTTLINLPDFIKEMQPYFSEMNIHFIEHPEYYQINTVKPEVLKEIKSKINDNMIIKNIDYALNNPASDDSVKHFWKRVLYLNNKNHNIENFIPEIKEIIR